MSIAEWIGIISVTLVLIGMAVKFNNSINVSESRSKTAIDQVIKDSVLKSAQDDEKYVEVKVCKIVHTNAEKEYLELTKKIDELTKDVKKLLAKAGIS